MITIEIECGCGQHYAFEVEPVGQEMPWTVACPSCGVDGTAAANDYLAQLELPPSTPRTAAAPLRVNLPSSVSPGHSVPRRSSRPLPGQIGAQQALTEASAKISWGDAPQEVAKFLMLHGFSAADANAEAQKLYLERVAAIRGRGVIKLFAGIGCMLVPVIALATMLYSGVIYIKALAITIMVGLWGLWLTIKGIFMLAAPKSESGDIEET